MANTTASSPKPGWTLLLVAVVILLLPAWFRYAGRLQEAWDSIRTKPESAHDAEEIGDVDLNPHMDYRQITSVIHLRPSLSTTNMTNECVVRFGRGVSTGDTGTLYLVEARFAPRFGVGCKTNFDDERPYEITVKPPFKGSLLGIHLAGTNSASIDSVKSKLSEGWMLRPGPDGGLTVEDTKMVAKPRDGLS